MAEISDETGEGKNPIIEELDNDIDVDNLPFRGDPEQFLIAVENLKEGGARRVGELDDEIEEYGSTNLSGNLKFGEILGFIERTSDGVALTDRGYELAFAAEEEEDLEELFRRGLQNADPYQKLLTGLLAEYEDDFDSMIKNSDVLQIMRTKFGMREVDENKLKRAVSIFFDAMEEAGYGERKENSGGYPIRLSFDDEWTLRSMVGDLAPESDTKGEEEPISEEDTAEESDEEVSNTEETDTAEREQEAEENGEVQISDLESIDLEENGQKEIVEEKPSVDRDEKPVNKRNVDITVNIDLDVNDMDTAEFEKKLEYLGDLLHSDS